MPFVKQLPHWGAPGIEPPLSLRQNGWKAGVKPPDEYFNYLQNRAYEALKELQENAVHKDDAGSGVTNLGFRGLLADPNGIGGPANIDKYPEGMSALYTDSPDWAVFLNMTDFVSALEFLFVETNKTIQDGKVNATQQITRYKKESNATPVKLISQYKRVWYSDAKYKGWSNAEKVVFQTEFATHLADDASTTKKGHVQLSDATNSTSIILASTANAVKKVWDMAFAKYSKPTGGIPKTDLESTVQTSLGKADSAMQSVPDASTTVKGIVMLDDAVNSTSVIKAATANAVKKVKDSLSNVSNYGIATQVEAETGTSDQKYMTPLKVKQAVTKFTPKNVPNGYAGLDENGNLVSGTGRKISTREFISEISGSNLAEFSLLNIPQEYTGLEILFDIKARLASGTNEQLFMYYNSDTVTYSSRTVFNISGSFGSSIYEGYGNVGSFRIPLVKPTLSPRTIISEGTGGNGGRISEVKVLSGPEVPLTSLLFRCGTASVRFEVFKFQLFGVK